MGSKEKNMDLTSTENEAAKKAKKADRQACDGSQRFAFFLWKK